MAGFCVSYLDEACVVEALCKEGVRKHIFFTFCLPFSFFSFLRVVFRQGANNFLNWENFFGKYLVLVFSLTELGGTKKSDTRGSTEEEAGEGKEVNVVDFLRFEADSFSSSRFLL